jgi:hypothetical protein
VSDLLAALGARAIGSAPQSAGAGEPTSRPAASAAVRPRVPSRFEPPRSDPAAVVEPSPTAGAEAEWRSPPGSPEPRVHRGRLTAESPPGSRPSRPFSPSDDAAGSETPSAPRSDPGVPEARLGGRNEEVPGPRAGLERAGSAPGGPLRPGAGLGRVVAEVQVPGGDDGARYGAGKKETGSPAVVGHPRSERSTVSGPGQRASTGDPSVHGKRQVAGSEAAAARTDDTLPRPDAKQLRPAIAPVPTDPATTREATGSSPNGGHVLSDSPAADASPVIRVSIGRIEVRGPMPRPRQPASVERPVEPPPKLTLDEYLQQRTGGRR